MLTIRGCGQRATWSNMERIPKIVIEHLNFTYDDGTESLLDVNFTIYANEITVLFGPAGGGKSTLLRVINRLNDLADVINITGKVLLANKEGNYTDILDSRIDVIALRRRVGMVFARPIVLPLTIRQNLTYSLELTGIRDK